MPTLITHFQLDVETGKRILNKFQFFVFKIKGMQVLNMLKSKMKHNGTEVKDEENGFSALAEGSDEGCREGYERIMNLFTDCTNDPDLKRILNSRDIKKFKKSFYKGLRKLEDNGHSFLMLLNSVGIIAEVKII